MSSKKNGPKNKKNSSPAKPKKRQAGAPKRGTSKSRNPPQGQAVRGASAKAPSKAQAPTRDRVTAWRRATMVLAVIAAGLVGDRVQHASAADLQRMKDVGALIREAVTTAVGGASLVETLTKKRRQR
jgi:hypothetical protein